MNINDYRMDYNERRDYVYKKAYDVLENDTDAFVEACEELDSWDGLLGDSRCYCMNEIDELLGDKKPSEMLDMMGGDFDKNDEYFYFSIYGLESTSDIYAIYSDEVSTDDLLDKLIEEYNHVRLSDSTLNELLEVLYNEDFGIEYDTEIDEDMDEDDLPEETDDEFKERIDAM